MRSTFGVLVAVATPLEGVESALTPAVTATQTLAEADTP